MGDDEWKNDEAVLDGCGDIRAEAEGSLFTHANGRNSASGRPRSMIRLDIQTIVMVDFEEK